MKLNLAKIVVFGLVFVFLISGLAVMGLHFYTDLNLYPRLLSSQNSIQQYEKLIMADFKTLEGAPLFKPSAFKKDATAFLQEHLSSKLPQNHAVLKLFARYPDWLTDKVDFKGLTSAPEFASFNPKWLEQLKHFDHWAWSKQTDIQDIIEKARKQSGIERIGTLTNLPIPNFDLLRHWAAIYAIQKLQTKDLQAGLKIYRKIAELSHTTGTLVGQMQAVALLKAEHKLLNDFQARDWKLLPLSSIDAYKRLSWAWVHLVRQPFYSELKTEIKNYAHSNYGVCAAASENMANLFGIREFLEPQVSFETNFSQNYARAEKFQESLLKTCHLDNFTELVEFSSLAEKNWFTDYNIFPIANISTSDFGGVGNTFQRINWSRVPFVRKFIGLTLFEIAIPQTLSQYRELAAEKK